MDLKIDMKQAEETAKQYELLDAGIYDVVVEEVIDKLSAAGTAGIQVKMKTLNTDVDRYINVFLYENKMFPTFIFNMCRCFGVTNPKKTSQFEGCRGRVKYSHKIEDGEKVGEVNPFRGFIPISDEEPVKEADKKEAKTNDSEEDDPF